MDLTSLLGGQGLDPGRLSAAVSDAFKQEGGVEGLLGKLRAGGLGDVVDSWVSPGPNKPVEPERLGEALGPDTVNRISADTGISITSLLPMLAAFLPMIIDKLTPDGNVPKDAGTGQGDIGDLLGGILGGGGLGGMLGGA